MDTIREQVASGLSKWFHGHVSPEVCRDTGPLAEVVAVDAKSNMSRVSDFGGASSLRGTSAASSLSSGQSFNRLARVEAEAVDALVAALPEVPTSPPGYSRARSYRLADDMGWGPGRFQAGLYAMSEPGWSERSHAQFYNFAIDKGIDAVIDLRPPQDIHPKTNQYYPEQKGDVKLISDHQVTAVNVHVADELKGLKHRSELKRFVDGLSADDLRSCLDKISHLDIKSSKALEKLESVIAEVGLIDSIEWVNQDNLRHFLAVNQLVDQLHLQDPNDLRRLLDIASISDLGDSAKVITLAVKPRQPEAAAEQKKMLIVHYLGWEDFSVIPAEHLIGMGRSLLGAAEQGGNSVVHCRGGIGRTGTLITYTQLASDPQALSDLSHQEIEKKVKGQIRHNRATRIQGCVETPDQYRLIVDSLEDKKIPAVKTKGKSDLS